MNRICLINPPTAEHESGQGITPHIGIQYIASFLGREGFETDIIECPANGIGYTEVCWKLEKANYDIIGIAAYGYNHIYSYRLSKFIKRKMSSFVFWGGYLPTLMYQKMYSELELIDCMVIGEGEVTVTELVDSICNNKEWKRIRGICYLENSSIVFTGKRKLIQNLDILPFPQRNNEFPIVNIITSRGCYANCSFCSVKTFYKACEGVAIRYRTPQNILLEIKQILKCNRNIRVINFNDDNFTLISPARKAWIRELCVEIKKLDLNINFSCLMRTNDIIEGREELKLLKEIGLKYIFIGIESFVSNHLKLYNKNISVDENIKALKIIESLDLQPNIGFLLFNPITTCDDILATVKIFRKIKFNDKNRFFVQPISASAVIAYEGSDLYNFIKHNNLFKYNKYGYKFQDKNVEVCFRYIQEWDIKIKKVCGLNYLEDIYERTEQHVELKMLRDLYYQLFYLDLEYIEKIVLCLKNKENDINSIEKVYDFKIERIYQSLVDMEIKYENSRKALE